MKNLQGLKALDEVSIPPKAKKRCFDSVSIVVTHNRKRMLSKCVNLLINQSIETDILIVNNASTDGTEQELKSTGVLDNKRIHYFCLNINTGGAGGFHYGLKYAYEHGWNWFWLMDDDAEPHLEAFEKLVQDAVNRNTIYGSAAVQSIDGCLKLCFPIKRNIASKRTFRTPIKAYLTNFYPIDL